MKYVVKLNQRVYEVEIERADGTSVQRVEETRAAAKLTAGQAVNQAPIGAVVSGGADIRVECPMPGKVLSLTASVGQSVRAGDCLFVIEAMKMENEIVAPQDGTVKQILVSQGTMVDTGDILAVII